jgi:hypothetical protein
MVDCLEDLDAKMKIGTLTLEMTLTKTKSGTLTDVLADPLPLKFETS